MPSSQHDQIGAAQDSVFSVFWVKGQFCIEEKMLDPVEDLKYEN